LTNGLVIDIKFRNSHVTAWGPWFIPVFSHLHNASFNNLCSLTRTVLRCETTLETRDLIFVYRTWSPTYVTHLKPSWYLTAILISKCLRVKSSIQVIAWETCIVLITLVSIATGASFARDMTILALTSKNASKAYKLKIDDDEIF